MNRDEVEARVYFGTGRTPERTRRGDAMRCFHCDQKLQQGTAVWVTWGVRRVLTHKTCKRADLVTHAADLGVFPVDDPSRPDQQLIDAIAAEKLAGEWLARLERLPSEQAQRDAIHRLRLDMEQQ